MPILKDWFGYAIPFISFSVFGISSPRDWNEQNASKKDSDTSAATSGARDKRCGLLVVSSAYNILTILSFRRDQEDAGKFVITSFISLRALTTPSAELPARATFRSTSSQPSQMGNFKHQSIRSSEREKDKDADRDRERDLRDKEGQERIRSVSP
jgi:hypothetical protein